MAASAALRLRPAVRRRGAAGRAARSRCGAPGPALPLRGGAVGWARVALPPVFPSPGSRPLASEQGQLPEVGLVQRKALRGQWEG